MVMKFIIKSKVILLVVLLCGGCAHYTDEKSSILIDNNFNSTLWTQNSSEFAASSLQTYNLATSNLDTTVRNVKETAAIEQTAPYTSLPPAVIMDIDETVLDNSKYDAKLILTADSYSFATWDQWLALQQATAIPGAVSFINYAKSSGVEVIFITNRMCKERVGVIDKCPQKPDMIANLEKIGITDVHPSTVLLRNEQDGWTAEKASRREVVAKRYRIVMLFGDDLGDFLPNVKKNITPEQRENLVNAHSEKWGNIWYILPNPRYGSWLRILGKPRSEYLEGY